MRTRQDDSETRRCIVNAWTNGECVRRAEVLAILLEAVEDEGGEVLERILGDLQGLSVVGRPVRPSAVDTWDEG